MQSSGATIDFNSKSKLSHQKLCKQGRINTHTHTPLPPTKQICNQGEQGVLTHSGEADSNWCSLANMLKHFGFAVASDVMSDLKVAKRP